MKPTRTTPRQRLSVDERRQQLITLGLAFFTEHAYDVVAIEDIARAAGISKGLLYHYFPTKRDFFVAVVREAANQLLTLTNPQHDLPPLERLQFGIHAFLDYVIDHGRAYAALLRGSAGVDSEVAAIIEQTRMALLERLVIGLTGEKPRPALRVALRGWIGFVETASVEWLEQREPDREAFTALCLAMLQTAVMAVEA